MFISTNTQQINRNGKERTLHSFVCPALLYSFLKQAINRHQIYEPWREGERDTQKGALLYSFLLDKQAINRHQIYKPRMAARVFMAILFFESKSRKQRVFIAFGKKSQSRRGVERDKRAILLPFVFVDKHKQLGFRDKHTSPSQRINKIKF